MDIGNRSAAVRECLYRDIEHRLFRRRSQAEMRVTGILEDIE